jgi:hypothetical protein
MKRLLATTCVTLFATTFMTAPAFAQVRTPDRPVTDPKSVESPANPHARAVPVEDIGTSRSLGSTAWSVDGKQIFVATNLTGRTNIWRTDASGSWPVQLTQSDDAQSGLAASPDGKYLYFQQDVGGNEYTDIYRVPVDGGAVENLTNTPDRRESGLLIGPNGLIALTTKLKSEGQIERRGDGRRRQGPRADQGNRSAVRLVPGRLDRRRQGADRQSRPRRFARRRGLADRCRHRCRDDADRQGRHRLQRCRRHARRPMDRGRTDEGTGQTHAGLYDTVNQSWKWLKPTPVGADPPPLHPRRQGADRRPPMPMSRTTLIQARSRDRHGDRAVDPAGRELRHRQRSALARRQDADGGAIRAPIRRPTSISTTWRAALRAPPPSSPSPA